MVTCVRAAAQSLAVDVEAVRQLQSCAHGLVQRCVPPEEL